MPQLRNLPTWILASIVPVVAALAVIVTLATTSSDSPSASAARPTEGTAITIKDFAYSPGTLRVPVGEAITVTNADGAVHTITADDKSFDTGDLDGGATASITIDKPGKYTYFCDVHNYMTGTIEAT